MTNLNNFAKDVTLSEGKKVSQNIGQVKEIIKLTLLKLKGMTLEEVSDLLKRVK